MVDPRWHGINDQAAASASAALSSLCGQDVEVHIARADVLKVSELSPTMSPEAVVAGIYLPVTGAIEGAVLLIIPQDAAFMLCDMLVKRSPGTTRQLTELDKSALKEVGNIVSGNYLAVLSNALDIKVIEHVPNFTFDMFGAIVSQVITDFARDAEAAMVVEVEFRFKPAALKAYLLLLFRFEHVEALFTQTAQ